MIENNPELLEEGAPAELMEAENQVSTQMLEEEQQAEIYAGEEQQAQIMPEGQEQVAGLGRALGDAGKVVKEALTGAPRKGAATKAAEETKLNAQQLMNKISDYTDPATVDVTRWNSDYIEDIDDIKAVLQGSHDYFDFEAKHPALKVQAHNETLDKALEMDEDEFATTILNYKPSDAWNSQQITRGRMMMTSIAADIYEYAGGIAHKVTEPSGRTQWKLTTQDPEQLFKLHKMLTSLSAVQYATEGAISEAGRALNSMKIKVGSPMMDQANLNEKYIRMGGVKTTEKLLNMVMEGDFAEMTKVAKHAKGNRLWNITKDLWYFGMLSGISTHEKNIIGNTIVSLNGVQEKYTGWVWGKAFDMTGANKLMKSWEGSHLDRIKLEDANDFAVGTLSGYILAFKLLGRRLKEAGKQMTHDASGGSLFPEGGLEPEKVDLGHVAYDDANRLRGISAENFGFKPESVQGKMTNFVGDWVTGSAGNALGTMDDFYKTIAYEQSVMYHARRTAREKLGDDYADPDKLYPLLNKLRQEPSQEVNEASIEFARQQTFTDDLDSAIGKLAMQAHSVPIVNAFVPFVRTVSNILKYGIDRIPLIGQVQGKFWKDIKAGGQARDHAMARLSTGGIMAGVATMAFLGETKTVKDPDTGHEVQLHLPNFTGRGSSDYKVRKLMMQAGWLPYAIRDPKTGKYTPYDWIEPFGTMFGAMATTLEIYHNTYDETAKSEIEDALVLGLAEYTMDKSYMMGFSDMLEIMQGDKDLSKWAAGFAATTTMPNFMKNIRKDTDEVIRGNQANTGLLGRYISMWKNRNPWLSEEVPPYVDVWGEDLKYGDPMFKYHSISPAATRRITDDVVTKELAKLFKPNQEDSTRFSLRTPSPVIQWLVKTPNGRIPIQVDLKDIDETGWAYSDYQKLVGKERRLIAARRVKSKEWKGSSTEEKYLKMADAFTTGHSKVKDAIMYGNGKILKGKGHAFLQKYRDLIQSEAQRIYQEKVNMNGGQYDYTSVIDQTIEGKKPDSINHLITPEF